MNYTIMQGDNRDTLKSLNDNSVDAVITDPPYGIDFLGKNWDSNTGAIETYQECLRVLKPGGYILAFSAARTYHHLAITLEQAGFEVRDQLMWLYASGFPKAQDIGKAIDKREQDGSAWQGWKTALKPAHEPICMARKPYKGSCVDNVMTHGTGALNIDACRLPIEGKDTRGGGANGVSRLTFGEGETTNEDSFNSYTPNEQGRYPSNVIGEVEGYQKFFYCPKVNRKERHCGFDTTDIPTDPSGKFDRTEEQQLNANERIESKRGNNHPTVKPVALMTYLINLVTPPNSTVLDPFCGSGSTGMAAVKQGHTFIGCELDPAYVGIANKRIAAWNTSDNDNFNNLFEEQK